LKPSSRSREGSELALSGPYGGGGLGGGVPKMPWHMIGITQKAIPAGSNFTYKFQIDNTQVAQWVHSGKSLLLLSELKCILTH
jgi:hypothetical protein